MRLSELTNALQVRGLQTTALHDKTFAHAQEITAWKRRSPALNTTFFQARNQRRREVLSRPWSSNSSSSGRKH
jgi:hypothetical protein